MNTNVATNPSQTAFEETSFRKHNPLDLNSARARAVSPDAIQWSWACRKVESMPLLLLDDSASAPPLAGDLAVVRVEKAGFHKYLTTAENRRLRLYPGAQFVGVFGNRYAADAYEAEVEGSDNLSLLTGAGMIGTVKSKHDAMTGPTRISLVGFIRAAEGGRLNLKDLLFRKATARKLHGDPFSDARVSRPSNAQQGCHERNLRPCFEPGASGPISSPGSSSSILCFLRCSSALPNSAMFGKWNDM